MAVCGEQKTWPMPEIQFRCYFGVLRFVCWRVEASSSIKNATNFVSEVARVWKKVLSYVNLREK